MARRRIDVVVRRGIAVSMAVASVACSADLPASDGGTVPPATHSPAPATTRPGATAPTTTSAAHGSHPMPSAPQNVNLEKFRNVDAAYNTQAKVDSPNLNVSKLAYAASPQGQWFKFNGTSSSGGQNGQFRTICEYSHLSYDDPIVFPGQPGKAHLHMYFGNTAANAHTTSATIAKSGGSTCDGHELNRTAYWFPALLDASGKVRIPNNMILYYKSEGVARPAGGYSEMPTGLKMIAGNPAATSPQPFTFNNGWACGGGLFTNPQSALIPNCTAPNKLSQKVAFPRCWDGKPIDANEPTYVKHVVYASGGSAGGTCPAGYPKVFSTVSALFEWDLNGSTKGWHLSSDMVGDKILPGGTTSHGDWLGGWNPDVMKAWTQGCLNAEWNCQTSILGNKNTVLKAGGGLAEYLKPTTQKYDTVGPVVIDISR